MRVALNANVCVLVVFISFLAFEQSAEARRRLRFRPASRSCANNRCGVIRRPSVIVPGRSNSVVRSSIGNTIPSSGVVIDPAAESILQDPIFGNLDRSLIPRSSQGNVVSSNIGISGSQCGTGRGHSGTCGTSSGFPRPVVDSFPNSTGGLSSERTPANLFTNSAGEHPIGGIINPGQASRPVLPEQVAPITVPPPTPPGTDPLICSDPKKAICGDPSTRVEEEKRIAADRLATVTKALQDSGQTAAGLTSGELNLFGYRRYLQALALNVERKDVNAIVSDVKNNLRSAVRLNAPPEMQGAMISKLESVIYVPFSQLVIQNPEFLSAFILTCGPDGMSNNAVYFDKSPFGRPMKALCPNYLSEAAKPEDIFATLAHELGHSIDAKRFPSLFGGLLGCYEKNYAGFTRRLAGEATADFWMQQSVAMKFAAGASVDTVLNFMKVALSDYCLPGPRVPVMRYPDAVKAELSEIRANPEHPNPNFRVDAFARSPQIRKIFGCKGPTSTSLTGGPPVCGLTGEI